MGALCGKRQTLTLVSMVTFSTSTRKESKTKLVGQNAFLSYLSSSWSISYLSLGFLNKLIFEKYTYRVCVYMYSTGKSVALKSTESSNFTLRLVL